VALLGDGQGYLYLPEVKPAKILTNIQHFNPHSASDSPLMKFPFDSYKNIQ